MKLKGTLFFVVIPVILTAVFLIPSSENYTGILALVIATFGLLLSACFSKPVVGSLFLIISMHWIMEEGIYLTLYFLMVANLAYLLMGAVKREVKADFLWFTPLLVMVLYLGLVILKRPYNVNLVFFFVDLIGLVLFAAVSLFRWDCKRVQNLLNAHIFYIVVWCFIEYLVAYRDRVGGPSLSATNLAALITASWTIWFINGWLSKLVRWPVLFLGTVSVCICVIMSGSRMGFIGIGVGGVFTACCFFMRNMREQLIPLIGRGILIFASLAVFAVLIWIALPDDLLIKRGFSLLAEGKLDNSSLGRLGVWLTAADVVKKFPIWGCGPGNFLRFNRLFLDQFVMFPMVRFVPRLGHAHNIYLMILAEQGMAGFLALGSLCLVCFRELFLYIKNQWDGFGFALLGGAIVFMTLGFFDVFPLFPSSLGWGAWYMGVLFSLRGYRKGNK